MECRERVNFSHGEFHAIIYFVSCILFRKRPWRLGTRPAKITELFTDLLIFFILGIEKMWCEKEKYFVIINVIKIRKTHRGNKCI